MNDYGTAQSLHDEIKHQWRPPPKLTISEWAERHRVLPASAALSGRWRNARAPHLMEIMNAVSDPAVKEVWWMSSSQVGKTELLLNVIGYYIHSDPGGMLLVQPTVEMAESVSKERLAPMLRDSPALRGLVAEPRASGSENTILHKAYHGGALDLVGANSPAGLASRPKRIILADEVDRYDASAGNEGDPLLLARKRSTTYHNRRFVAVSTPTIAGLSRIEKGYLSGDQRRRYVPCPHCGEYIELTWERLDFSTRGTESNPVIICGVCDGEIMEHHKPKMLAKGIWKAHEPFTGIASFYLSELYSPFSTWSAIVAGFKSALKIGAHAVKVWRNTSLGLPYEESGTSVHQESLIARAEPVKETLPSEVLVLTAGIDVQGDRLEYEIVGWYSGDRSYSVDYQRIYGNPKESSVWNQLDAMLKTGYTTEDGRTLKIVLAAIDTGDGNTADHVMAFALARQKLMRGTARGVIPCKGASKFDAPVWSMPTRTKDGRQNPWMIGVSQIKIRIMDAMQVLEPEEPGFMRFPEGRDEKYFAGLTAEKLVTTKDKRGWGQRVWYKIRERNEPLDCRVYAYAALRIINPDYDAIEATAQKVPETDKKPQIQPKKRPKMRIFGV